MNEITSGPPAALARLEARAVRAARAAGALMRRELRSPKRVHQATQHDIKLELDVRCQTLIERSLQSAFPTIPVLGEEGESGDMTSPWRWVVDPIDGTVNFAYGLPHACVSIALQRRPGPAPDSGSLVYPDGYQTCLGVVYDPFCDELWTARTDGAPRLNGRRTSVSARRNLREAIITLGFAKTRRSLDLMLPSFNRLVHAVRKIRIMGSAALALTYVATGRMDGYVEAGVRLWDIAAGGFLVERAGGRFEVEALAKKPHAYRLLACTPAMRQPLRRLF